MNTIDQKILMELQHNAKQNTKEIASKVGLTVTPTYERIKKLEQQGFIKSYTALLDRTKIGKSIIAFCQVSLIQHHKPLIDQFEKSLSELPEVMECHNVSGNFDFLLKVAVEDMNAFHIFLNEKLSIVEGISNIYSLFVMNTVKESSRYQI